MIWIEILDSNNPLLWLSILILKIYLSKKPCRLYHNIDYFDLSLLFILLGIYTLSFVSISSLVIFSLLFFLHSSLSCLPGCFSLRSEQKKNRIRRWWFVHKWPYCPNCTDMCFLLLLVMGPGEKHISTQSHFHVLPSIFYMFFLVLITCHHFQSEILSLYSISSTFFHETDLSLFLSYSLSKALISRKFSSTLISGCWKTSYFIQFHDSIVRTDSIESLFRRLNVSGKNQES